MFHQFNKQMRSKIHINNLVRKHQENHQILLIIKITIQKVKKLLKDLLKLTLLNHNNNNNYLKKKK